MSDTTPTPDQTPTQAHEATTTTEAPTSEAKPSRRRPLLIAGGIAAAIILAGGGVAVGSALSDDDDDDRDDRASVSQPATDEDVPSDDVASDEDDDDAQGTPTAGTAGATIGADSADRILEVVAAARAAADGDVTSVDAERDGSWDVQLTTSTGDETDVRVDTDLVATVTGTDRADADDTAPATVLSDDAIRTLVTAALDEADGRITDIDVDGEDLNPYDVSVLGADNRTIEIELDADMRVVRSEIDD